jgi:hypothetical protein
MRKAVDRATREAGRERPPSRRELIERAEAVENALGAAFVALSVLRSGLQAAGTREPRQPQAADDESHR